MKRIFSIVSISVLLAACGQDSSAPQTAQVEEPEAPPAAETAAPEKHSGVLLDYIDADVRPGDDFNAFVNGAWMATAEIPSDRPLSGVGLEVHEQAVENVRVIIEKCQFVIEIRVGKNLSQQALVSTQIKDVRPFTFHPPLGEGRAAGSGRGDFARTATGGSLGGNSTKLAGR